MFHNQIESITFRKEWQLWCSRGGGHNLLGGDRRKSFPHRLLWVNVSNYDLLGGDRRESLPQAPVDKCTINKETYPS